MDDAGQALCIGVIGAWVVRRPRISSTPTVLVLGPDGAIAKRAVGLPRKADVIAALGTVIQPAWPGATRQAGGE